MAKKSKRILCAILSLLMVLTMIPMGVIGANAVESTDVDGAADLPAGQIVVPNVTITSTPVIRTAASVGSYLPGTTLTRSTPSGLGYLSSGQTTGYYANETPVSPTVVFTSDKSLEGTPGITCENNTYVTFDGPVKSGNTYTWTITGGKNVDVGALKFVVGYNYKYTDTLTGKEITKSYNAYATSSVEKVAQPGGMYNAYRRKETGHSSAFSIYAWRIVGKGVFGSFYEPASTTDTWSHGVYKWDVAAQDCHLKDDADDSKFNSISSNASGAVGYGMVYHDCSASTDGNKTSNTGLDSNRPISTVYLQEGYSLDSSLLRCTVYEANDTSNYEYHVRGMAVLSGDSTWNADTQDNNTARGQLGMDSVADTVIGKLSVNDFPMTGTKYTEALKDGSNGNKEAAFTIIFNLGSYYDSRDRVCNVKTAVDLHIVTYDKEDLLATINETVNQQIPTTPYAASSEAGYNPNENFYSAGWAEYKDALQNAQYVYNDADTNQNTIDAAALRLQNALNGLKVKEADYTAVDLAKDRVKSLNSTLYTDETWLAVQRAVSNAVSGYSVFFQPAVDNFATVITNAISGLKYRPADYSEVEALVEAYGRLVEAEYTADTWKTLKNAVTAVDYTVTAERQNIVDGYRDTIAKAIKALVLAPANYSALNTQVQRYNQVLPQKDYYRVLLWRAVEAAYQSIDWNLNWKSQDKVDDVTNKLKTAIDNLEYDDADYTQVNAAITTVSKLDSRWYTADSWKNLQDVIATVDFTLNKTQQATVNGYLTSINNAIDALIETTGDFTNVNAAIERAGKLNQNYYTADSWTRLQNAISAVDYTKLARYQTEIEAYANNINLAIDSLVEFAANYTAVNTAVSTWNSLPNKTNYTEATILAVQDAVNAVDYNVKISNQAIVDGYAVAINSALDALKLKTADYSKVDEAVSAARKYVNKQGSFAVLYNGHSYYTDDSFSVLTEALAQVSYGLDITHQTEVNGFVTDIVNAYSALNYNDADYTAVYVALTKVPDDLYDEGLYDEDLAGEVIVAIMDVEEGLTTEMQDTVDGMAKGLEDAIKNLKYKGADYSAIDDLVSTWANYPNKDSYTAESVRRVDDAFALVIRGYDVRKQDVVDAMELSIKNAISNLGIDVANYSAVTIAIANANDAKSTLHTTESLNAVDNAISAVVYNLKSAEQSRVNGFALAINNAVAALKYKTLNVEKYNSVIAKIPSDLSIYTTSSATTVSSVYSVAKNFVDSKNDIRNQDEFDVIVDSLDDAITALKKIGADYSKVSEAIRSTTNLNASYYSNWSAVEDAIDAVIYDFDITKQADVDAMATAINTAVKNLSLKNADYSCVDSAKDKIPADLSIYREDTVTTLNNAVSAVTEGLKIDKQGIVDGYAAAILEAIEGLKYATGDYKALNALVASAKKIDGSKYANYSEVYGGMIYPYITVTIPANSNYTVAQQSEIDAMVTTLQGYIDMLVLKDADYTKTNQKVNEANEKIASGFYTEASVAKLNDAVDAIEYGLDIEHQAEIDIKTGIITDAIDALVYKSSDFSKVDALYKEVKGYDQKLYINYVDVYWGKIYPYYNTEVKSAKKKYLTLKDQDKIDAMYDVILGYKAMLKSVDSPVFVERIGSTTEIYENNNGKFISGLKTALTQKVFLADYVEYSNVIVEIKKSNSTKFLGTGTKVIIKDEKTGETVEEYAIVINGDIDGNGKVDYFDYDLLSKVVFGSDVADGAYLEAADINCDGVVDGYDLSALSLILAGVSDIQTVMKNISK